ncbi:unnamed protein product [Effrenium voratum]|uniref:TLC domain-containing protein n=1 Tax=Effrenium voratum TaxID=2562239 RepID=A0AA36MRW5_9DINO|nr:unnamed protein product [Effrenium voratum]CAJ1432368.1 unnamed protein product [Effrenium voratum]
MSVNGTRLTAGLLHDWLNIIVLSVIFVLCVAAIFLGEDSDLHSLVVAVTVAYLISDGLWILLQPDMVRTPKSIIAHHVVTLIVIMDPLQIASHRVNASRALLVEVNTVLLTLRRLLGHPVWCEVGFYLTWVLIRLVWFPVLGASLLASAFELPQALDGMRSYMVEVRSPAVQKSAASAFAAVVLLQFYWTLAMGRSVCKRAGSQKMDKKEDAGMPAAEPAGMRIPLLLTTAMVCITATLLRQMSTEALHQPNNEL